MDSSHTGCDESIMLVRPEITFYIIYHKMVPGGVLYVNLFPKVAMCIWSTSSENRYWILCILTAENKMFKNTFQKTWTLPKHAPFKSNWKHTYTQCKHTSVGCLHWVYMPSHTFFHLKPGHMAKYFLHRIMTYLSLSSYTLHLSVCAWNAWLSMNLQL